MPKQSFDSIQSEIARLQRLAKRLKNQQSAAKQRARRKVFALMKKLGLSIDDLTDSPTPRTAAKKNGTAPKATTARKRRTKKVPIKYRGPHRGDTWTGRGKTPRWLAALIADGKKKEDFLISK